MNNLNILLFALLLIPATLVAQTGGDQRVVPVEATIRAGIDRDMLDSVYIDGSSRGCTRCRFDEASRDAYDDSWNDFLGQIMSGMLEKDVSFSQLVVRAYFAADGRLDYLLFHVGGDAQNNARFVSVVEAVRERFRFAVPASGPFKQSATISLGSAE